MSKMLDQLGIEKKRFRLEWVSAAEGDRFAQMVKEITEEIRKIGPFKKEQQQKEA
jgi:F420-non-reducing hydrogenase iron-sulfur subunit